MTASVKFSWNEPWPEPNNEAFPICAWVGAGFDDVSPLACLTMDDGGLGLKSTIEWLDEGLLRLGAVLTGKIASADWGREDWGASFDRDIATIYSMHFETCSQRIETASFRAVLDAWRHFVAAGPEAGTVGYVET